MPTPVLGTGINATDISIDPALFVLAPGYSTQCESSAPIGLTTLPLYTISTRAPSLEVNPQLSQRISLANTGAGGFQLLKLKGDKRKEQDELLAYEIQVHHEGHEEFIKKAAIRYGVKLQWMKDRVEKDSRYLREKREASPWNGFVSSRYADLKGTLSLRLFPLATLI